MTHSSSFFSFLFTCLCIQGASKESDLLPMEISALRLDAPSSYLTAQIQVIDETMIKESGAVDLVELLRKEANLQVRSTSGNSARAGVSMGGFGENGVQRTLVLLDGHRLNAVDLSAINWSSIPLALVESIEVIRGAQSGTFGNNAVGGVIKINTKLPKEKPTGYMEAATGSFETINARGAYSHNLGGIGVTLFGERSESNGYRVNGDYETDAGGLRLDWGNEEQLRGYFSWSLSDIDFGLPGDLNATALSEDRRQTTDPYDRGEESSSQGRAGLSFEINNDWILENRLGYQDREVGVNMPSATWTADTVYETFSYSPILHYESNEADWMFGIDYFKDDVKADTNYDDSFLKRKALGLFVSTSQSISEQWNWNGNLRMEKMENSGEYGGTNLNKVKNEEWAGVIGLVRDFGDQDRLYGTIRRYYRYPATDEILLAWPPPSSLNPNLEPESGYEIEFGLDWRIENLFLNGRIFRQWMEDEIIYDSAAWSNVNLEKTRRIGLDFSAEWQIAEMIRSGVKYEYARATIEEGTFSGAKVPLVPEGLLRLFLELRPLDSLMLRLGGSFVGESFHGSDFSNSGIKIEDYWLYDLGVNYELSKRATLFGGVENLLGEEYLSTAFGTGLYPGEGRKARIGLRYSF